MGEHLSRHRSLVQGWQQPEHLNELKNNRTEITSNSHAELGAILEALRQNEEDDLEIESDSLTSLRVICSHAEMYEDQNWSGVRNSGLLKAILINLRTRPVCMAFKWVKGHEDNYRNNRADALANEGRESNLVMRFDDKDWIESNAMLQDRARLQTLEARHIYTAILKWHTKKTATNKHQVIIDKAKDRIEEATGLCPTNEKNAKELEVPGGATTPKRPHEMHDHRKNKMWGLLVQYPKL